MERRWSLQLPVNESEYGLQKDSSEEEVAATAIGQGKTEMTPLLLNRITAAVANGGKVYDNYLIDRVMNRDGSVKKRFYRESPFS